MPPSDLAQHIAAGPMDAARTLDLLAPVAGALDAAHADGRVHGALTPERIRVDGDGTVEVDGWDRAPGAAPEDDIAGLSRVLHGCLTGNYEPGPGPLSLVTAVRADVHPRIDWVCARGIATEPEDRQPSAHALIAEAAAALHPQGRRAR